MGTEDPFGKLQAADIKIKERINPCRIDERKYLPINIVLSNLISPYSFVGKIPISRYCPKKKIRQNLKSWI